MPCLTTWAGIPAIIQFVVGCLLIADVTNEPKPITESSPITAPLSIVEFWAIHTCFPSTISRGWLSCEDVDKSNTL